VGNAFGAPRPRPPAPPECAAIQEELRQVRAEIASLQGELRSAPPAERPGIVRQIRTLTAQASTLQRRLTACLPPAPPPWPNFGQVWDGRPFWTGRFSRSDRGELLFYFPGDGNWWLGTHDGNVLQWTFAGNTEGFGHGINDGRPFWIDDFTGDGRSDVLFYFPGDGNWWLGSHTGGQLAWAFAGNTLGAARPRPPTPEQCRPIQDELNGVRAEIRELQRELQMAPPGEKPALVQQIRTLQARARTLQGQLNACLPPAPPPWPNFGQVWDGRPFWTGRFSRADRAQMLFYFSGDGNCWLGTKNDVIGWALAATFEA
jgi:hypothetical protein